MSAEPEPATPRESRRRSCGRRQRLDHGVVYTYTVHAGLFDPHVHVQLPLVIGTAGTFMLELDELQSKISDEPEKHCTASAPHGGLAKPYVSGIPASAEPAILVGRLGSVSHVHGTAFRVFCATAKTAAAVARSSARKGAICDGGGRSSRAFS